MKFMVSAALLLLIPVCAIAIEPPGPAEAIEQERLMSTLKALPTERAARGTVESQKGLVATEEWLVARLKEMGYTPRLQDLKWNFKRQIEAEEKAGPTGHEAPETTPELAGRTWHNIVVEIPGKELPREVLVLSAHFDAVPGSPGADDDGTGVAALLEIARALKDRPMRRTVRLIFFNLEELGLLGSKEYVAELRPRLAKGAVAGPEEEKIVGMVTLEMLGYFSDAPDSQKSPIPKIEGVFDPPTVGDFIGLLTISRHAAFCGKFAAEMEKAAPGLKTGVADFPPIAPPDFLRSDHAPFLLAGQPAVMLTDTSNFRNPNYHKPTDTIETIDAKRFTLVARGVAGAAHVIAEPVAAVAPSP